MRRERYQINKFQLDKAKDYLNELTFTVELSDLYEIEETCHDNNNTKFCPILLKVKDEFIRKELGLDEKG